MPRTELHEVDLANHPQPAEAIAALVAHVEGIGITLSDGTEVELFADVDESSSLVSLGVFHDGQLTDLAYGEACSALHAAQDEAVLHQQ